MSSIDNWYKLDNVAKLFPATTTKKNSSTFRISVYFHEVIDPIRLQNSLERVLPRFPMYKVRIRRGLFWYFLETNDENLLVKKEDSAPCSNIDIYENNGYLLRVLYFNNKLSVEFFHSLADGVGANEFIKLLCFDYLSLKTKKNNGELLLLDDIPSPLEAEDSYKTYFKFSTIKQVKENKAYKIKGTNFYNFGNNIIKILLDSNDLKQISKKYGVSVTEFIVGLFIYSIHQEKIKTTVDNNPINIVVPVNLRNFFPSKTLRNFFSTITITLSSNNKLKLDSILKEVSAQFKKKLKKDKLLNDISSHYKIEKLIYIKFLPLFLKNIILRLSFIKGTKLQTACVSNLGRIEMPEEISHFIEHMEVILYSSRKNTVNCGVCSFNNKLAITFSRTIMENSIIKNFIHYLSLTEGVNIIVSSNQWGINYE